MATAKTVRQVEPETPVSAETPRKRQHKATYATDRRKGGYIVRVAGPSAGMFSGREVPVTTKAGDEHVERLTKVLWSGKDSESGENVALYAFEAKPRDIDQIVF